MKVRARGFVGNGVLSINDRAQFLKDVGGLSGDVIIEVKPYDHDPTPETFRYYYGVVLPCIHNELIERGEIISENEVHEMMKVKLLAKSGRFDTITIPSLGDLKQKELSKYIEGCVIWASKVLGIYIPDPGDIIITPG